MSKIRGESGGGVQARRAAARAPGMPIRRTINKTKFRKSFFKLL
jgi:hypothetical protein